MRELTEQEIVRRQKVDEIRKTCNPYPERYEITHTLKEASNLEDGTDNVSIAGRIVFMRKMGKLTHRTVFLICPIIISLLFLQE